MADRAATYHVGDAVHHRRYGAGTVTDAAAGRVVIRFGEEEKTFVPQLAPLTKMGDEGRANEEFTASRKNGNKDNDEGSPGEAGIETYRGGAKDSKPDPEWREFVKKWKVFEGKREDGAEEEDVLSGEFFRRGLKEAFGALGADDAENTPSRKLYTTQKDKGRSKGYAKWNPQRKTRRVMLQVKEILDEYRAELPLTARQIFYRLVGKYGFPKTESAYESLTNWLVRARRSRLIPFDSIRDDGASVMEGKFYGGEDDFYRYIHDEAKGYERDKLASQKCDIRVYAESAGMMPQLERVTRRYSVPVYSCSGFDSLTAKYDLAKDVASAHTYRGRQTVILHLGDMDPSGETIFDAISEDVHGFLEVDIPHKRGEDIAIFERVALTPELVLQYDLPTDPAKESSHSAGWGGRRACQLEALAPDVLAGILAGAIEGYMDLSLLEADRASEVDERRKIAKALPAPSKDGE